MTETPYRGVLIGCGFFAENHMHAWAALPGAEIAAVCDLDAGRAEAMAERFGIPAHYSDAATALAEVRPDFVDVTTTAASHRPLVELACASVGTVVCQKPFAESMEDAEAMVAAADRHGTKLIVHENFRWQAALLRMHALVAEGRIGTPHFARFSFRHGFNNYRNQPYLAEIERLAIMDVGLHVFDLARHFMGEVERISCTTQRINPKVRGEDAFTALLAHDSGTTSICDVSFYTRIDPEPFPEVTAWIEGDGGTLALDLGYRLTIHQPARHETEDVDPPVPTWGARPWHCVQDSVAAFEAHAVEVMAGRADPQPSGRDNLRTLALAFAAYESAATGRTVEMADRPGARA